MKLRLRCIPLLGCLLAFLPGVAFSVDWPMWRFDAARTASSPEELPTELHLQWTLDLAPPAPCWPETEWRLQFDRSYEPVAAGDLLFLPSMARDRVTAYDAATGRERWRFYADGPVRFAPVVWAGTSQNPRPPRLYFVADDGCLYCLEATTGRLIWKFRGAPSTRRLLGNGRFISAWPARGAPVLFDGTVYFAAGIWPFMGIFLYAVDADTGRVVWSNSGDGQDFVLQPHSSPAFAGVAPQGYLLATEDRLLVAGGRSVPAVYDRRTGAFLYHRAVTKNGGYAVTLAKDWFLNDGLLYRLSDGEKVGASAATVVTDEAMIGVTPQGRLCATALKATVHSTVDRKGQSHRVAAFPVLWEGAPQPRFKKVFLCAGSRLFGGAPGVVGATPLPGSAAIDEGSGLCLKADWQATIEGTPWTMIAANGRLFVVTEAGRVYCFAGNTPKANPPPSPAELAPSAPPNPGTVDAAKELLDLTGVHDGYAVVMGVSTGDLVEALVRQSELSILALASASADLAALRKRFDADGLYGKRITLLRGEVVSLPLSPYFASLVTTEDPDLLSEAHLVVFWRQLFRLLRPYGGVACFPLSADRQERFVAELNQVGLPGAAVRTADGFALVRRPGPLPGAGTWTHQYGDAGNTICSTDQLVKSPLALLWFGGPHNVDVLPRHGHGPTQQIIGGRLFIEGIKVFSARDVYTGRVLWRRELPDLDTFGMYYDKSYKPDPYDRSYNQNHIPGANQYGSNFTTAEDAVYLLRGARCLALDPATGETKNEFRLPELPDLGAPNWGYASVYGDLLLAAAAPVAVASRGGAVQVNARFGRGSKYLFGLNRRTGQVLWKRKAVYNFRHNAIAAGGGKVFVIDRLSPPRLAALRRRGIAPTGTPRLLALDAKTGAEVWTTTKDVFGTWLSYSEEYDVLLQAGSRAGDRAPDETGAGMSVYRGSDGVRLWRHDDSYNGPPILYHEWIITQTGGGNTSAPPAKAYNLLTGERVTTTHPLTGQPVPWAWVRFKGCNTAVAGQHLLTFRSAAGCYADLPQGYTTTSIGGFKSGCTSNLVAADGVLNAPDYTRTCTCSYQNQADFALYHVDPSDPRRPGVESWCFTWLPAPAKPTPVRKAGLNFGAPGDRVDPEGVLWLEVPSVGGPSPDFPVAVKGDDLRLFRRHMSTMEPPSRSEAFNWVGASGIEGVTRVVIHPFLQPGKTKQDAVVHAFDRNASTNKIPTKLGDVSGTHPAPWRYTVRLYFSETASVRPGERVFTVALQGVQVLTDFDPIQAAGAPDRTLVREFPDVPVTDNLRIDLTPSPGAKRPPRLCGVELIATETPAESPASRN